jgi:hypothetical protein
VAGVCLLAVLVLTLRMLWNLGALSFDAGDDLAEAPSGGKDDEA